MQYTYKCNTCNYEFSRDLSLKQAIKSPKFRCPKCGKSTRRLINPVSVHFKGAGFYSTDNKSEKPK
jgi:putative FmdB family regulatory protein